MSGADLHVFTLKLLALKKLVFFFTFPGSKKKIVKKVQTFFSQPTAQLTTNSPELIFHIIKCQEQASVLLSVIVSKAF